ncbi:hypothetical protein KBC75_05530 [Candidatus Shapirobacteria bacterium]|nr:hypothetical protein [Candidatus Shapirobacteria bacterium]
MLKQVPETMGSRAFLSLAELKAGQIDRIDRTADFLLNNHVLSPVTAVDIAQQNGRAIGIVGGLRGGADQVSKLQLIADLESTTLPPEKDRANEALEVLGKAVFMVMRYGGDDHLQKALQSPDSVDAVLPESMKGLGKLVMDNIIGDQLGQVLVEADGHVAMMQAINIKNGPKMVGRLEQLFDQTMQMKGVENDERVMVLAVLNTWIQKMQPEVTVGSQPGIRMGQPEQTDGMLTAAMLASKMSGVKEGGLDGASPAVTAELLKHRLEGVSEAQVKAWVFGVTDLMTSNELFFANGWQQLIQYVGNQLGTMRGEIDKLNMADYEKLSTLKSKSNAGERQKIIQQIEARNKGFERADSFVEAVVTVKVQEAAILHCDSTLETYLQMVPPADSMNRYVWNKDLLNSLEADPIIGDVHGWMQFDAYNGFNKGRSIDNLRKNLDDLDGFADKFARSILGDPKRLAYYKETYGSDWNPELVKTQARVAIATFIVDDYVTWSAWVNENAGKKVPAFKNDGKPAGSEVIGFADPAKLKQRKRLRASDSNFEHPEMGDVTMWKVKLDFGDGGTGIDHPLFVAVRPVDLLRVKNVYGEDIIGPLEKAISRLANAKWMKGRDEFPKMSEVGYKDMMRFVKFWSGMIGGPQADMLGVVDAKTVGAAQQAQNMFSDQEGKEKIVGSVVGDVLAVKIRALLTGKSANENFMTNMFRTMAVVGDFPKEQTTMLASLFGADASQSFGLIAEYINRLNLNINTPAFLQAKKMLQVSVTDQRFVEAAVGFKHAYLIADFAGAIGGLFSGGSGGKRK